MLEPRSRSRAGWLRLCLLLSLVVQLLGCETEPGAQANSHNEPSKPALQQAELIAKPLPAESKHITFDDVPDMARANITVGGAQPTWGLSLDRTVVYGDKGGQSLHVTDRIQHYNRIKINEAFRGLDLTPGTQYDLSLYAKVDSASVVKSGYFYLSVIDTDTALSTTTYYNDRNRYKVLVTDQDWVNVSLPFTVGYDPVYGIAFEQMPVNGHMDVVQKLYIDEVKVVKTGTTTQIPPSKIAPKAVQTIVDGKTIVYLSGKPEAKNGVPFVPLPRTFATLRADVAWDASTQTATAAKNGRTSVVTAGQDSARINGQDVQLAAPAYVKDKMLMVPASYVADALEASVSWNAENQTVSIASKKVNVIQVDKNTVQQEIWGFGASANDPVHDFMKLETATQQRLLDVFFGMEDDGVGLSVIRLEINPFTKDDPEPRNAMQATMEPEKGVWDTATDTHQRWFADQAIRRNPGMQFAASVWSPPAWMKDNRSVVRGGHLVPEHYEDFAKYLVGWAKTYKEDYGYNIRWISLQNEPEAVVEYASSYYNGRELGQLIDAVYDVFKSEGTEVKFGAPEGGHMGSTSKLLSEMDPVAVQKLDFIGAHFYAWDKFDAYAYDLRQYNKPLFMMEYSMPDPNDAGMGGGLEVAGQIAAAMEQGYSSYLYWWFVNKPASVSSAVSRQSLVDLKEDGSYTINKRLYTMGQFSRFIRPGDRNVKVTSGNSDITVTAAIHTATNKAVLVAANHSTQPVTVTISGLNSTNVSIYRTSDTENIQMIGHSANGSGSFEHTLPANSVTTFVE
ncbi:hypothetical protein PAESOLCIP111_04281 [Paenibacillus solanacearum]|uniref:Uncharacterized protein n=1 Tax=Paenibacillus solanacearum TaxID=2048548 RepID=A0A916K7J1_9BACL|nr:stalk domain-containing protein [Paenibacillus solanacearum]CAG7641895.1 hypothetical protein PAESOLCIP111_04281 [Paenibacillus solanacearum]